MDGVIAMVMLSILALILKQTKIQTEMYDILCAN
jgi:hypothetical protein